MTRGLRRIAITTAPGDAGRRLDAVVGGALAGTLGHAVSRGAVRRMLMAGGVRRNGVPQRRPGLVVSAGWRLELSVDPARLEPARDARFVLAPAAILYEDAWLIALAKPPGVPTVPTADPARPSLVSALRAWLQGRGGSSYLAVHQRLDRDTSGVVLFGRDPAANAGLAQAFGGRAVTKVYEALTVAPRARVPERLALEAPIDGKPAATDVRVLSRSAGGLHVEARPRTGRKHQVRIHLAGAGLPILGDERYGAPRGSAARTMLHARRIELTHPVTGAPLSVEAPLPDDFRGALGGLSERARSSRR